MSFKQQLSLRQYTESDDADTPTVNYFIFFLFEKYFFFDFFFRQASALRKWTRRRRRRIAELDNAVEQVKCSKICLYYLHFFIFILQMKRVAGGETSLQTMTNHVQQYANAVGDSQLGNQVCLFILI